MNQFPLTVICSAKGKTAKRIQASVFSKQEFSIAKNNVATRSFMTVDSLKKENS